MSVAWVGAGIAAVGVVSGAASANKAAKAQTAAADKASATQLEQYYQTREDQAPSRGAGTFALSQLLGGMGASPDAVVGRTRDTFDGDAYLRANPDLALNAEAQADPFAHYMQSGQAEGRGFIYTPEAQQMRALVGQASSSGPGAGLGRSFSLADLAADPQYRATVGSAPRDFSAGFTTQALTSDPIYARTVGNRDFSKPFSAAADADYARTVGSRDFSKGFTAQDLESDPSYRWRLQQGQQALERSAAARGGALSGGSLKDLTDYAQGAASQEYQNAYSRFSNDRANAQAEYQNAYGRWADGRNFAADQGTNAYNRWNGERATQQSAYADAYNRFNNDTATRFNRLSSLAGIGQTANNTVASLGAQTAAQVGQNQLAAGNAQAAGYVGQANAVNNGMSSLQSMYFMNKYLDNKNGSGGAGSNFSTYGGGNAWQNDAANVYGSAYP